MTTPAIDVDLREVVAAIERMDRKTQNLSSFFRRVRAPLQKDMRDHMKQQRGPNGPWAPLKSSTYESRKRRMFKSKLYTKKGNVRKAAQRKLNRVLSASMISKRHSKIQIGKKEIAFVSKGEIAGIHQDSGFAGNRAFIRKRVFVWISQPLVQKTAQDIVLHMRKVYEGT